MPNARPYQLTWSVTSTGWPEELLPSLLNRPPDIPLRALCRNLNRPAFLLAVAFRGSGAVARAKTEKQL